MQTNGRFWTSMRLLSVSIWMQVQNKTSPKLTPNMGLLAMSWT
jgi:hypothetical protein